MKTSFQLSAVTSALLIATAMNVSPVAANTLQTADMETIEVKGFRGSLIKGRDLKKDAIGTQDTIVAEDIADFPDLNLAEALQRIPGVAVTRDGGEGRRIALRGLDSNFSLVQLNGMDVLGNTDSAMDSRSQGSRDRAFDFNIFAAELFNQIDVKKSFSASQDEGGMAGTVGLRTAKPFDYDGFKAAISAQAGTNSYTDDISPRTALMVSNTWDSFGALASVSFSKRETEEKGANTYRWRMRQDDEGVDKAPGSIKGDNVSQDEFDRITGGEVISARGNRYSVWQNEQERLGITSALQYRVENFQLTMDFLYGELTNDRGEYHINPRNNEGSMPYGADVTINDVLINDMNELVFADYSNTVINTESRAHDIETEFTQLIASADWNISEDLTMSALVGSETSDLYTNSFKFYTETRGDVTVDYTKDRWYGDYSYGQDMTDPSRWWLQEVDLRTEMTESKNTTVKVDFDYAVFDNDIIKFGLSTKTLENAKVKADRGNLLRDKGDNGHADIAILNSELFVVIDELPQLSWAVVDPAKVVAGVDANLLTALSADYGDTFTGALPININDSLDRIEESTTNLYVEYQFDREIGDMSFRGNIGVRYYETETDTDVKIGSEESITVNSKYDGILPATNLVLEPIDDFLVRISYSQNITRPSYGSLSGEAKVSVEGSDISVRTTNPYLTPYKSDNIDVSLEWYFEDVGFFAIAYYQKDIEDYIVSVAEEIPYSETGLPTSLLQDDSISANSTALVTRAENAESASLDGVEISVQRDFDFLPAPFNNLGIVANATFANGSVNQYSGGESLGKFDFPNLSDYTNNITMYYETETWGMRLSQTYRGEYITGAGLAPSDEDVRGFHASTFWDLSAFYQVSEDLKISFEGTNLSNERDEQYSDSSDRAYNTTTSGRTYYLGINYQF